MAIKMTQIYSIPLGFYIALFVMSVIALWLLWRRKRD